MIKKLLVFTEGGPSIGLGHLVECKSIVETRKENCGLKECLFIVNSDHGAENFLEANGLDFKIAKESFISSEDIIAKYDAILVNKKNVKYEFLEALKKHDKKLIVIDELGDKKITADVLINFSVNKKRHNYVFPNSKPVTLFGPEYFPAGKAVLEALKIPKPKNGNTIVVSMGGYDNSRITDKALAALRKYSDFRKEVVLGPGFRKDDSFKKLQDSLDGSYEFYEHVDNLPERIRKAKFLISSGGDTLYEAAIVGTPVLVIGEDPHEIEQGEIFTEKGFALNVAAGKRADVEAIRTGLANILNHDLKINLKMKAWCQSI